MKKRSGKLILLYLASAALFSVLAILLRDTPNIVIDESLYTNIARGLAGNGSLTYRGQPVNYPYLLYPMFLVPVYWLQSLLGGDIYIWIKVFNALLITSSVFPVYLLAADITGDEKKAFSASVLTALIPDMLSCGLTMAESLIWPLALWMMFFAWRLISDGRVRWGLLTGLFAGLLYAAKPGAVAMGAGMLLLLLIPGIRKNTNLRAILAGLGALVGVILLVHTIYMLVFGYSFSLTGLYAKQTSDWDASHLLPVLLGIIGLPLVFVMSGAGIFVLLPYLARRQLEENKSIFLSCATAGLITAMLGTAVFVIPYQWNGTVMDISLHTRYLSMYLPVWIILTLDLFTRKNLPRQTVRRTMLIASVLLLALGLKLALAPAQGSTADAVTLGSFIHNSSFNGTVPGLLWVAALFGFTLYLGFRAEPGPKSSTGRICVIALAALLLFNGVCAACGLSVHISDGITADARQLNGWLQELQEEPLGIMQRHYADVLTFYQESRLTRPMQQITMDQAVSAMNDTDGVYSPFVPLDQAPNSGNGLTPDTSFLVLGQTVYSQLELSDQSSVRLTDNGTYALVTIPDGTRWVDSMLYGIDESVLFADTDAILLLFDSPRDGATLRLDVSSPTGEASLTFTQGNRADTAKISGAGTVEIPLTAMTVYIRTDRDIQIDGYSTR